ncbi:hypothetical protein BpHYR1_042445 [Brachionus plicatilis]|uniref:Uncharacterized protein n=1 Tax=Brachionus plicatilis TaxID=10195 RepID=A0A3M7QWA2_BRAPC|nr:hypothetical protein BpHYR1_042445 [Brachionus plicatilis]
MLVIIMIFSNTLKFRNTDSVVLGHQFQQQSASEWSIPYKLRDYFLSFASFHLQDPNAAFALQKFRFLGLLPRSFDDSSARLVLS